MAQVLFDPKRYHLKYHRLDFKPLNLRGWSRNEAYKQIEIILSDYLLSFLLVHHQDTLTDKNSLILS